MLESASSTIGVLKEGSSVGCAIRIFDTSANSYSESVAQDSDSWTSSQRSLSFIDLISSIWQPNYSGPKTMLMNGKLFPIHSLSSMTQPLFLLFGGVTLN